MTWKLESFQIPSFVPRIERSFFAPHDGSDYIYVAVFALVLSLKDVSGKVISGYNCSVHS